LRVFWEEGSLNGKDGSKTVNFVFDVGIISGSFYHLYSLDTVYPGSPSENFHFQWSLRAFGVDLRAVSIIIFIIPVEAPFPYIAGGIV